MNYYKNVYLANRLKNGGKPSVSIIELAAINAIDNHNANGEFALIVFLGDECYVCDCTKSDKLNKYSIQTLKKVKHSLNDLYNSDNINTNLASQLECSYFDNGTYIEHDEFYPKRFAQISDYDLKICEALSAINVSGNRPLFIAGKTYADKLAVRYAIQQICGRRPVTTLETSEKLNLVSRVLFNKPTQDLKILLRGQNTIEIIKNLGRNGVTVYVPHSDHTLNSSFLNATTWREIIPGNCVPCKVNGVDCYCLSISFEIDGFNNVFCRSIDGYGNKRYIIVHAPFGKPNYDSNTTLIGNKPKSSPTHQKESPLQQPCQSKINNSLSTQPTKSSSDKIGGIPGTPSQVEEKLPQLEAGHKFIEVNEVNDFRRILGKYLIGVTEIELEDPWLYERYHLKNLEEFIRTANDLTQAYLQTQTLKKITIITRHAAFNKNKKISDQNKGKKERGENDLIQPLLPRDEINKLNRKQLSDYKRLTTDLTNIGIEFTFSFNDDIDDSHDRCISLSNGWFIALGRGLDIYQKSNSFEARKCKGFKVTFTDKKLTPDNILD